MSDTLIAGVVGTVLSVVAMGVLLWLETRKRKDAETSARDWEAEAKLERDVAKGLGSILRKRNEENRELRRKLSIRDRFERLFEPPKTD